MLTISLQLKGNGRLCVRPNAMLEGAPANTQRPSVYRLVRMRLTPALLDARHLDGRKPNLIGPGSGRQARKGDNSQGSGKGASSHGRIIRSHPIECKKTCKT